MEPWCSLPCSQKPSTDSYPVHTSSHQVFLRSILILPSNPRKSLPCRFPNQNIVWISNLSSACYIPRPSHPPDLITLIIFGETYGLWSLIFMECSLDSSHFLLLKSKLYKCVFSLKCLMFVYIPSLPFCIISELPSDGKRVNLTTHK